MMRALLVHDLLKEVCFKIQNLKYRGNEKYFEVKAKIYSITYKVLSLLKK